jgi:hypothetical protein
MVLAVFPGSLGSAEKVRAAVVEGPLAFAGKQIL